MRGRLAAARAGRGAVVLLSGEPGIGKTALAAEVADQARRGGMVAAWGRCREDGDAPPYRPWVQVLREVLEGCGRQSAGSDRDRLLAPLLGSAGGRTWGEPGRPDRFRLFEAMVSALAWPGSPGVLAVIDDLHRADEASLAFLRYLAVEVDQLPLVVLGAYRDTETGPGHPLMAAMGAMADGGALEVLALPALAEPEVRTLVARHAGSVPDEVADQVVARAEGNPFFVVEMARLLRSARGELSEVASTVIPPTVREVISHRLARLPSESRRALRAAAVLGREFGRLPLSGTLGCSAVAVTGALQPAAATGLIFAEGRSGYSFTHALVQAAIYDALPYGERTLLHRRAAAAIAALHRDDDEAVSALAYHSYRASLGGDPGAALAHVLAAGRRAGQRLAFEEAARWLGCVLELTERAAVDPCQYMALLCEAADAEISAGAAAMARSHYESAADLARQNGDSAMLARAALGVGSTVVTAGKVDWPLVRLLQEADASTEDVAARASLQSRLAIELYWHQGSEPSRQRSLAALAAAEASGSDAALTVALHARQFTLRSPDHLDERIAIGERLTELAHGAGNTDLSFQGAVWLAADVLRRGDLVRYRSLAEALEAQAVRARRPLWRWYATVMRAQLAAVEGRVDDAYEATETAGALGRQLGIEVAAAYRIGQLCVLHRERHGLAPLLKDIQEVSARLPYFVTIRALAALGAATTGRRQAAAWEIDRLSGHDFAAVPRDALWVATIALMLEAAAISHSPHTRTLVGLLAPHRGTLVVQGLPSCWGSVDRFMGLGQRALGDLRAADRALADALAMESDLGAPIFTARTKVDLSRLRLQCGSRRQATELAAEAAATAELLHLDALAEEARGAGAGAGPATIPLSHREREVLALVSEGASNKDIASSLVISLNTVERHLANIYTKLGVRGRAEAAAYAVRAGLACR
jgi:DNA-binding CsgD family transcriptional regulator